MILRKQQKKMGQRGQQRRGKEEKTMLTRMFKPEGIILFYIN